VCKQIPDGGAGVIVAFNHRDFLPAATDFSIHIITPNDYLRTIKRRFP